MLACATIAANGISGVSLIITICVGVLALLPEKNKKETLAKSQSDSIPKANNSSPVIETDANSTFRLYRQDELIRICASLLANGSILVTGEQGSGKSVLAWAVVEKLREDGFTVAFVEPATTKQMLVSIAEELGVETQSKTGTSLTTDQLKQKIENSLKENVAFLIVDDCQNCDSRFRHWLKQLKKLRVPILLLATNPPGTDVFSNMLPLILTPLPEYAIRALIKQAAFERGLNLKNSDLARLQQRASGNPMQAQRVIDEKYSGLEVESDDQNHYIDITPLILIVVVGLMVLKFVGLGTNNHNLYIVIGIGAAVFFGVSRLLYIYTPRESEGSVMMSWTHIVVSATATSLILGTANPAIITVGAVSGLLPDVDISTSAAGKVLPWVSHWLERRFPHRSCTHSLFASGVIATVAYGTVLLSGGQFWQIAHAINIGYFFGWFIDAFTKSGVEIFWPSPVRCVCPENRKFRLGSGSSAEYGLLIIVIALAIASFNINANGGLMTHFNRLIGSPTGVTEIYNKSGSTHLITAHIEGVQNINREPVSLDFTIIEARGQDFIVQSADGKIYKTGLDSSAQIIAEHITADVKKLAITNIEPLNLDDDPLGPTLLKKFNRPGAMVFVTGQISIDDPEGVKYIADPYQFPFIKLSASSLTLEVAPLSTVLTYFREQYATGQLQMRVIHEAATTGNT